MPGVRTKFQFNFRVFLNCTKDVHRYHSVLNRASFVVICSRFPENSLIPPMSMSIFLFKSFKKKTFCSYRLCYLSVFFFQGGTFCISDHVPLVYAFETWAAAAMVLFPDWMASLIAIDRMVAITYPDFYRTQATRHLLLPY